MTFPNVHVECSGLWDKDASLGMVEPVVRLTANPTLNLYKSYTLGVQMVVSNQREGKQLLSVS